MTTENATLKCVLILDERKRLFMKNSQHLRRFASRNKKLLSILEAMDCNVTPDSVYGTYDVSVTGDAARLRQVWRVLRMHGFTPDSRPVENMPYFSAFFRNDQGGTLFLQFSSNVCKRVQVGTELKEVPKYEVQCDSSEPLNIEEE